MALAEAAKEATWLSRMLKELDVIKKDLPTQLYCDNQGALALAGNPAHHKRSKHIEIRYHSIKEKVDNGQITIHHVRTNDQAADMLTKPLKDIKHKHNCQLIHLK
jgi:methyl coenzyme M reductase subunit D